MSVGGRMVLAIVLVSLAALASGCGAARDLRAAVRRGPSSTPTMTRTPRPTSTPTLEPTSTPAPLPTATPTPPLPPNPRALLRWPSAQVHFCISEGGAGGYESPDVFVATVERAFNAWGIAWYDDGACGPLATGDGVSEIGWGDLGSAASPRNRVYEAGLTQTTASECRSSCDENNPVKLTEADITIDSAPPREFRTRTCLDSTLLHEAGHFLGLEHLPAPAVMEAQTSGCPIELTSADRAALAERYGAAIGG